VIERTRGRYTTSLSKENKTKKVKTRISTWPKANGILVAAYYFQQEKFGQAAINIWHARRGFNSDQSYEFPCLSAC
jgi:hypothetical protein